jgi:hypothetical protein
MELASRFWMAAALIALAISCGGGGGSGGNAGSERGQCYPNHTCNDGLECLRNVCVRGNSGDGSAGVGGNPPTGGPGGTAGPLGAAGSTAGVGGGTAGAGGGIAGTGGGAAGAGGGAGASGMTGTAGIGTGGTNSTTGSAGQGAAGSANDGQPCVLPTSTTGDCNPTCAQSCGTDQGCLDSCCQTGTTTKMGEMCGGQCVDVTKDPSNCGTCGNTCGAGDVCRQAGEGSMPIGPYVCKPWCHTSPPPASIVAACSNLCSMMGPECADPLVWPFPRPPDVSRGAGGSHAWSSADACQKNCLMWAGYTGPCADMVAALANCWAHYFVCAFGIAELGSNVYLPGGTCEFRPSNCPNSPPACSMSENAAWTCVNQCAD